MKWMKKGHFIPGLIISLKIGRRKEQTERRNEKIEGVIKDYND